MLAFLPRCGVYGRRYTVCLTRPRLSASVFPLNAAYNSGPAGMAVEFMACTLAAEL